jgi:hypothetical protein
MADSSDQRLQRIRCLAAAPIATWWGDEFPGGRFPLRIMVFFMAYNNLR